MTTELSLPLSGATVSVKILRTAYVEVPAHYFFHPIHEAHPKLIVDSYAFLIEHPISKRTLVFDLGVRKDVMGAAPAALATFGDASSARMEVDEDVATQLKKAGVPLESIEAIVWSHSHLDHTGDPSTFPSSTKLVLGPGTLAHVGKGYPADPNSLVLETDFKDRDVVEVKFDKDLSIGGFKAHDYFGDGSFYLLDVPGHCPGHMAGLARTTANTFLFMGGDTCHHPGVLRPSSLMPIPSSFQSDIAGRTEPFLTLPLSKPAAFHDLPASRESLKKLQVFDAHPNVFVVVAHDSSIESILDFFPRTINDWKARDLKNNGLWLFLQKGNRAYRLD